VIVVADAGPLHYLILIEAVDVLYPLYESVLVPQTVSEELKESGTPEAVRTWMERPPEWCQIRLDPPFDRSLDESLDPGECALAARIDDNTD
jgi:predicted nucleic acid-binding protein